MTSRQIEERQTLLRALALTIAAHFHQYRAVIDFQERPRLVVLQRVDGTGPDSAAMYLELDMSKDPPRLMVTGRYPHGYTYTTDDRPVIGMTTAKTALQLANEINRRFLPRYTAIYQECVQRKKRAEYRLAAEQDATLSLAHILGEMVHGREQRRPYVHLVRQGPAGHLSAKVEPAFWSEGHLNVALDLRGVPFETACEICELLAALPDMKGYREE